MPYKSQPVFGLVRCQECSATIIARKTRDLSRRRFCGRRCRQLGRYRLGEMPWACGFSATANVPEVNAKKGRRGSLNGNWIADRTKLRCRPRHEGDAWREAVFKRDDFTCVECGQRGGRLQADHIKPYCAFPELRWEVSNGRTLCVPCHRLTPTYGSRARRYKEAHALP